MNTTNTAKERIEEKPMNPMYKLTNTRAFQWSSERRIWFLRGKKLRIGSASNQTLSGNTRAEMNLETKSSILKIGGVGRNLAGNLKGTTVATWQSDEGRRLAFWGLVYLLAMASSHDLFLLINVIYYSNFFPANLVINTNYLVDCKLWIVGLHQGPL